MEGAETIPKPNNGFFTKMEDLHKYYNYRKEKYGSSQNIPIIFSHIFGSKRSNGAFLFFTKPQFNMKNLLQQMTRKAVLKHKELDKHFQENTSVRVMDTKFRFININQSFEKESAKEFSENSERLKDKDGFIHFHYSFSYENQFETGINGFDIAVIIILAIPFIPFLATYQLYQWTSNKISNINLPSFRSSHSFKYKEKYTLKERKEKFERIQKENPGRIQIIVEKHVRSSFPDLPFSQFLIEEDKSYLELSTLLKKRILKSYGRQERESKESIFFVIGGKIPNQQSLLKEIYDKFKDEDGMLYLTYQEQESF